MIVSEADAAAQLSALIERAIAGEDVVIERGDRPAIKLVPQPAPVAAQPPRRRAPGGWEHLNIPDEAFFEPMTEAELAEWE